MQNQINNTSINLIVIYMPHGGSNIRFYEELATLMEITLVKVGHIMPDGDFNIRMGAIDDPGTIIFSDFLQSFDLQNMVPFITHKSQNHLDLVIQQRSYYILQPAYPGHMMSDHLLIHCNLNIKKVPPKHHVVSYRKLKAIDMIKFSKDIETSFREEGWDEWDCTQDAVDHYNNVLGSVLNKYAPIKTKLV